MGTNGTDSAVHLMFEEDGLGAGTSDGSRDQTDASDSFAFDPFVNRIALGIARELATDVKQLEHHVDSEVRRLEEAVERRLLQVDLPELSRFAAEQQSTNGVVQDQLQ